MKVSIIIPCYNESNFIKECIESIVLSCIEFGGEYEIIIADGGSDDGTKEKLSEISNDFANIKIMVNEKKLQVHALNMMIDVANGEYIVRCDAHAIYSTTYISDLIGCLKDNVDFGNVGTQVITKSLGGGVAADAISICLGSKFGVGGSHRSTFSNEMIDCDTVLFGAWNRGIFDEVGRFDEEFVRGQDLEHNMRIISKGYRVVQLPIAGVTYFSRSSYKKLFNMMKQYASVKPMLFKKGYGLPNYRALIPILMYMSIFISSFIAPFISASIIFIYLLSALSFSFYECIKANKLSLVGNVFIGYLTQHAGHAYGMVIGVIAAIFDKKISWHHTR